jgi:hypothetical protein
VISPIEQFARDLLSHRGALVEPRESGLDVMAAPALAATLGLAEYQRLIFTPDASAPDAVLVDYDSPLVERMGRLIEEVGRVAFVRGPAVNLKPIDPEAELSRGLTLLNGVFRCRGYAAAQVVCFGFLFEFDILADERAGGVITVWVNPQTRSVPRMASWLSDIDLTDEEPPVAAGAEVILPWDLAIPAATSSIRPELQEFLESVTRRRDRDLRRLREYYLDVDREIRRKLARGRPSDEVRGRELQRLEGTARIYQARLLDVADRYRVRVCLAPLAVLACRVPTYQLTVRLLRRNAPADVLFSWNPIDGRLERRGCDGCHTPVDAASLCDDRVHYLCGRCLDACPQCGKPYCRACHVRCPRRHEA